ncbi:adenylate kinase [Nocardioides nitrophenolicus]|uniref:adenylate kinase n=1 Tax=Nocardioides nitrophenolicus TaxID=60489 RepID=UPI00195C4AAF|nr:adenylate kinase [Nocardioides nitrophenolicus]MBM7515692.1 adenylate kinase [Nocardioides nitrophenolicus]
MRLLLMGPPGAGKGTQAAAIAERFGVPAVSTGDIFRANVAGLTPLGRTARRFMDAGEYVPDEVTNAMVADRLAEADCDAGFLLDGYPRTLQQVTALDEMLERDGAALDAVVLLEADPDELVRRLLLRAQQQGRADDTDAVIRRRLDVYAGETAPLAAEYDGRRLLATVDGLGAVDEVAQRILAALASLSARPVSR